MAKASGSSSIHGPLLGSPGPGPMYRRTEPPSHRPWIHSSCNVIQEYLKIIYKSRMGYGGRVIIQRLSTSLQSTAQFQARYRFTLILGYEFLVIVEYPTVTVKCRTAIIFKRYSFTVYLSVMLNSLSCSFTSISFLAH